jgi:hypothetical protein
MIQVFGQKKKFEFPFFMMLLPALVEPVMRS